MSRPAVATGEVWLADLDPTVGSEVQTALPCVLVSPPEMHDHLRTVIVAPMSASSQPATFRTGLTFQGQAGLVLLDQVRTLDKVRLVKRLGTVHPATLQKLLTTLQAVVEAARSEILS